MPGWLQYDLSPDGRWTVAVIAQADANRSGDRTDEIVLIESAGGATNPLRRLAGNPPRTMGFSPDGRRVVFDSGERGAHVWVIDALFARSVLLARNPRLRAAGGSRAPSAAGVARWRRRSWRDGRISIHGSGRGRRKVKRCSGSNITAVNANASKIVAPSTRSERTAPNSLGWPSACRMRSTA